MQVQSTYICVLLRNIFDVEHFFYTIWCKKPVIYLLISETLKWVQLKDTW